MPIPSKAIRAILAAAVVCTAAGCTTPHSASTNTVYFLSTQDGRAALADGAPAVGKADDTLAVIEVSGSRLRVVHQIAMPVSLVGPPSSIAIAPGGRMALISAATRRDPVNAEKVVPYDLVSVVALDPSGAAAPRVIATVNAGAGASGISINRAGTLALVANRVEGSVSVLAIDQDKVAAVDKVMLGEKSGPAHVAFTPDGRRALVTRDGDNRISMLAIDGRTVKLDQRAIFAGLRPYGLDISSDGHWAAVTNLGAGSGDADTISLIDLRAEPPRTVDTITVGQTPEGVVFSPDGSKLGVTVINGSNKPKASPFFGTAAYVQYRIDGGRLLPAAKLAGGQWLQGHAFTPDGHGVLVQDAMNRQVRLYRADGNTLADTGERLQFDCCTIDVAAVALGRINYYL
ncbi:YncE family protein [Noviherbaspirillum saxi]|uniref:YncE family protein n=1 Tax=Noviherbaspirillum saxi TaxID=2320863 RepID=A0A3A3FJC5_9BURK|nr:YncE family protein [Noviherbaspirillum saxi]RJF95598.1 YncE family protein [Noviherbaspirillum saxi]